MLNILVVDDSEDDALIVTRELRASGLEIAFERVETAEAMRAALADGAWDAVLCDYMMPEFDVRGALKVMKDSGADLPFLVVSGTLGEERAADLMKIGAHDIIHKDKLARLLPALKRELKDARDRQERRRMESELQQNRDLLDAILKNVTDGIVACDAEGKLSLFNPATREIHGLPKRPLPPDEWADHYDLYMNDGVTPMQPDDTPLFRAFNGELVQDAEIVVRPKGGEPRRLLASGQAMFDAGGGKIGAVVSMHDITERAKSERALRESERRFRSAFESAGHGVALVATDGRWLEVNDALCDITGYGRDNLLATDFQAITHPDDLEPDLENRRRTLAGEIPGYQMEKRYIRKDGGEVPIILSVGLVRDDAGEPLYFVSQMVDISVLKETQSMLTKLSRTVEQSTSGVVITDLGGAIEYVNPAFTGITGFASEEVIGRKTSLLRSGLTEDEVYTDLWQTIQAGETWRGELVNRRKDGNFYHCELTVLPVQGDRGVIVNFVGISRDVTAQRETERQLQQAQKMEAVGQLTGGIAHDFNNILSVVLGNLQLLQRRMGDDRRLQKLAATAVEATLRGADLTKRLLAFSRRQELEPAVIQINDLVAGMDNMFRRTLGEHIKVKTTLSDDLGCVKVDPSQLESAILNLAINARDAMSGGGTLLIETSNVELDENYVNTHAYARLGPNVCLSVTDTGTGIAAEIVENIFEPFFTTKEVGKGTGLGLSMVYGFLKQSGGHINVYSEMGVGTRFRIYLPRTDEKGAALTAKHIGTEDLPIGTETVFVVEDESLVRETAALLLEDLGYIVVSEADGPSALKALEELPRINLLFTDIIMPGGMNGHQLAERVLEHNPDVRILLTSGYPRDTFHDGRKFPLLSKPYTNEQLAKAVRSALDDGNVMEA